MSEADRIEALAKAIWAGDPNDCPECRDPVIAWTETNESTRGRWRSQARAALAFLGFKDCPRQGAVKDAVRELTEARRCLGLVVAETRADDVLISDAVSSVCSARAVLEEMLRSGPEAQRGIAMVEETRPIAKLHLRPEVADGARFMELQMRGKDALVHSGEWKHWKHGPLLDMISRLNQNVDELGRMAAEGTADPSRARRKAADVANLANFIGVRIASGDTIESPL